MLRSLSFSTDRNSSYSSSRRTLSSRSTTPIQRIWRYISNTELTGYRSELYSVPKTHAVDDGHPLGLGNPTILRNIFTHLDAPELISLRRVSLRWNHIACEKLRRNLQTPVAIRPSQIKTFLRLMKRCFCNPFGNYAIRIENLRDLHLKNFFKRFSLDIIKLRVKISSDEIPEFFNRVLQCLPNLEELHLIRIPESGLYLRADFIPSSAWVYGVFHFPQLKYIIFENDEPGQSFHRNYDAILSQVVNSAPNLVKIGFVSWDSHLARVISRCGISNPKSFDGWQFASCNPKLKQDLLELFYDHRMKFKALKFWINDNPKEKATSLTFELVMDLTLQTGESLYHLALRNDDPSALFLCSIKLRRLLTLNLQGWAGPVHFPEMSCQLPNLKSLKLNPSNFSGIQFSDNSVPKQFELPTVESLTVMPLNGSKSNPVDEELMETLVTMCPCVTELYVQVDGNEPLHVVYRSWNRLSKLWVDIRGVGSDEAFTGIPPEFVKIRERPPQPHPSDQEDEELEWCGCCAQFTFPPEKRRSSHVGNLTELRHLIVRAGCLSEASLSLGISHLNQLQVLWLLPSFHVQEVNNNSDNNSIEGEIEEEFEFHHMPKPWCLRAIGDNFKHLRELVTSTEVVYSQEDVKYLQNKLPELVHRFDF